MKTSPLHLRVANQFFTYGVVMGVVFSFAHIVVIKALGVHVPLGWGLGIVAYLLFMTVVCGFAGVVVAAIINHADERFEKIDSRLDELERKSNGRSDNNSRDKQ